MDTEAVVSLIFATATNFFEQMLPIIGVMTGIVFFTSFLLYVTIGIGRRVFGG